MEQLTQRLVMQGREGWVARYDGRIRATHQGNGGTQPLQPLGWAAPHVRCITATQLTTKKKKGGEGETVET
jgi:hypothetical protein